MGTPVILCFIIVMFVVCILSSLPERVFVGLRSRSIQANMCSRLWVSRENLDSESHLCGLRTQSKLTE